jgi:hypothetical protein
MKPMDKTDSKVRLFLELSHPHPIQILSYTPICKYEKWDPKEMYSKANSQYFYAFVNDKEVIEKLKRNINTRLNLEDISGEIENAKKEIIMPFEFNGEIIDESIPNPQIIKEEKNEEEEEKKVKNEINLEEEKFVVFCRFNLKEFGFIHKYEKIQKEDLDRLKKNHIVYALKGGIKFLLKLTAEKNKKIENQPPPITHIKNKDEENEKSMPVNDAKTADQKKEDEDSISKQGIDGHWFLINNFDNIDFLSFIKYKEIFLTPNEMKERDRGNPPLQTGMSNQSISQNFGRDKISSSGANTNLSGLVNPNLGDERQQPLQFSYLIKDSNKSVSIYQNISCIYHHNKNDFICKTCNMFCCSECFLSEGRQNNHFGPEHKIILLDEALNKFEEDAQALAVRINNLKVIINNEIEERRGEILNVKDKNEKLVKKINEDNKNIKAEIKKEELNRAKILGFLGNEALRIIGDYNLKIKYLNFLYKNGDMNSYLINYFLFIKYYQNEIRKNLNVLQRKIIQTFQKFKTKNDKLNSIIEDLEKNLEKNNN